MVTVRDERLLVTYRRVVSLDKIMRLTFDRAKNDRQYLRNIDPVGFGRDQKISKGKQNSKKLSREVDRYLTDLVGLANEQATLALIFSFEQIAFDLYRNAFGIFRKVVKEKSVSDTPFFRARERFIRDDLDKLSQLLGLLDGFLNQALFEKLVEIKNYRDYLAHGKRFAASIQNYTMDEIAVTLDEVIYEIRSGGN